MLEWRAAAWKMEGVESKSPDWSLEWRRFEGLSCFVYSLASIKLWWWHHIIWILEWNIHRDTQHGQKYVDNPVHILCTFVGTFLWSGLAPLVPIKVQYCRKWNFSIVKCMYSMWTWKILHLCRDVLSWHKCRTGFYFSSVRVFTAFCCYLLS